MAKPYGWELIVDLHDCSEERFTEDGVRAFCETLCDRIGMVREDFHLWASDPAERAETPAHLYGVSAVQFITTSSLVVHTLPKMQRAYVNLFSCRMFDQKAAAAFIADWFGGRIVTDSFLVRW